MKKSAIAISVNETAKKARGFLEMIDDLRALGIMTFPRFSKQGRLLSLRFGVAGTTVTSGEAGINDLMSSGPIYRSVMVHNPVLKEIALFVQEGRPQPVILNDAREVDLDSLPRLRDHVSPLNYYGGYSAAIMSKIFQVNDNGNGSEMICAVFDRFTLMDDEALKGVLARMGEVEARAIMALPEPFRGSALRWTARGMVAVEAFRRQHFVMAENRERAAV